MLSLPDSWVWDFWTVEREAAAGREYHLFFLYASKALHDPDRRHVRAAVGHAVSADLMHWERVVDALVHGDPGEFDETATWTGSVVSDPAGGWRMFYTGMTRLPGGRLRQQIGAATSDDLLTWHKVPDNPVVTADPRWYETMVETDGEVSGDEAWRDPFVYPDPEGGGWHMLITARANRGPSDARGVIAHATSADLRTWTVHPPVTPAGSGFAHLEVAQIAEVDGRTVLLFDCLGTELTGGHPGRGGVWCLPLDDPTPQGQWDVAAARRLTDEQFYVGKIVTDPAGRSMALAFHNTAPDGSFGGVISNPVPVRWDGDRLVAEPPAGISWDLSAG